MNTHGKVKREITSDKKFHSRFASTAINWLGGKDHMVEAGADSDVRLI